MEFDPARLRAGEYLVGAGGLVLLASTFLLPWYGLKGRFAPTAAQLGVATTVDGWNGLTYVRWLVLLTALVALSLLFFQATRRSPAIPVSLSVITTVLAILTLLALIYRVLIDKPGGGSLVELKVGAYVSLISALALIYGGYLSTREEGISLRDAPAEIETVSLQRIGES